MRLRPHPVLEILPPLTAAELEVAVERVRLYGQRMPIEVIGSEIVTGFEEYAACLGAGVTPKTKTIKPPPDIVEYVMRTLPRNLTSLDRAVIAVLAEQTYKELGRERMREAGRLGGRLKGKGSLTMREPFGHTNWYEAAARIVGTTPGAVKRLATIRRSAPDVFEAVRSRNLIVLRDARDLAMSLPTTKARLKVLALKKKQPHVPIARLVATVMRSERRPLSAGGTVAEEGDHWAVYGGPLEREGKRIADASVDLVHADIVYGDTAMAAEVGRLAGRVLVNGGILAMIAGAQNVLDIMNAVAEFLTPLAVGAYLLPGNGNGKWPGPIERIDSLPVLFFGRGRRVRSITHLAFTSDYKDKDWRGWSKNVAATLDLIASTVDPGSRVLDPCVGGGTTGEAALRHGCEFIGIDVDRDAVQATRARLAAVERELVASKPAIRRAG